MYQKRKINPGECNYLNGLMDHAIQKYNEFCISHEEDIQKHFNIIQYGEGC